MDEEAQLAAAIALSLAEGGAPAAASMEHGELAALDAEAAGWGEDVGVSQFLAVTGTSDGAVARAALARASGDVQVAVEHFFGGGDTVVAEDAEDMLIDRVDRASQILNTGNARDALDELLECLGLARAQGHRQGEGAVLGTLGNAYTRLGEYRKAIDYHEQALAISVPYGGHSVTGVSFINHHTQWYRYRTVSQNLY